MGVPSFFRWLVKKYPKVSVRAIEEQPQREVVISDDGGEGETIVLPVDASKPNPNRIEFDNLYLDMNGIIHPCCNPPKPNEEEMFVEIFKYIERIFLLVRPRKVLFMAIDGVAPRAKMNQQRSRRFKSAHDKKCKAIEDGWLMNSDDARLFDSSLDKDGKTRLFDSNCITPGTPFMDRLAKALRTFISIKLNTDPAWRNLNVILSDATVPGEGEHKIMDFIRAQRSNPTHDPNTRHIIHGLDADLIMLALATHEPHFTVLREDVLWVEEQTRKRKGCFKCGEKGHQAFRCPNTGENSSPQRAAVKEEEIAPITRDETPFVFVHIFVLREYLEIELQLSDSIGRLPFVFELERAIDDWVMLCFFVGNDFLPHIPSLEIREGALDKLVKLWRDSLSTMGGFITDNGKINLERLQIIIKYMADNESRVFETRRESELKRENNNNNNNRINNNNSKNTPRRLQSTEETITPQPPAKLRKLDDDTAVPTELTETADTEITSDTAPASLGKRARTNNDTSDDSNVTSEEPNSITVTAAVDVDDDDADADADGDGDEDGAKLGVGIETIGEVIDGDVRLHEEGYLERFYSEKFNKDYNDIPFRIKLTRSYLEGMCWVLHYYYKGCASWNWYYPFHYAPFAQDFLPLADYNSAESIDQFELGEPLFPFEQLMGVLPAASRACLPDSLGELMVDLKSPILDFYPHKLKIDKNGEKAEWRGVVLLPFVDETRLLAAVKPKYELLDAEERARNSRGSTLYFVWKQHPAYNSVCSVYETHMDNAVVTLDPRKCSRMAGSIKRVTDYIPHLGLESDFAKFSDDFGDLTCDMSICVQFILPQSIQYQSSDATASVATVSQLLPGVVMPNRWLKFNDIQFVRNGGRMSRERMYRGDRSGFDDRGPNVRDGYNENTHDYQWFYAQDGNQGMSDIHRFGGHSYNHHQLQQQPHQHHHQQQQYQPRPPAQLPLQNEHFHQQQQQHMRQQRNVAPAPGEDSQELYAARAGAPNAAARRAPAYLDASVFAPTLRNNQPLPPRPHPRPPPPR